MINDHLSDTDIQQYVLDKVNCGNHIMDHIHVCDSCNAKALAYGLLFTALQQQESPAFDFDLTHLVLSGIAQSQPKKSGSKAVLIMLTLTGISSLAIAAWLFGDYYLTMFSGITSMAVYLTLTVTVTFLIFQGIEMYKKYQKQMDALNFN